MKLQIILVVLLACICLSAKPARRTKNGEGFVSNVKETSEHTKKELQKLLDGTKSEEKAFDKKEVEGKQTGLF